MLGSHEQYHPFDSLEQASISKMPMEATELLSTTEKESEDATDQITEELSHLSHLQSLGDLPKLEKLDVRWNRLAELPAWIAKLERQGCTVFV